METQPIKQLRILKLIFLLIKNLFRHGNIPVFYHICLSPESYRNPMEAEGVEIRKGSANEKRLTIW